MFTLTFSTLPLGCSVETSPLKLYRDDGSTVSYVKFEYPVYNLATDAPYNTVQLKAFAYSMNHIRLDIPVTVEIVNLEAMELDSSGVLRALGPASNAVVRAFTKVNDVTSRDSAYINIINGSPSVGIKRIGFELSPGDSAKAGYSAQYLRGKSVKVVKEDSSGNTMTSLQVAVWGSNSSTATLRYAGNNLTIDPIQRGKVTLYISTYAFGRGFMDSLEYTVGWPVTSYVAASSIILTKTSVPSVEFHPKRLIVGQGACVSWMNNLGMQSDGNGLPIDIVFEDTVGIASSIGVPHCSSIYIGEDMESGNIAPFIPRLNPVPGGFPIIPASQYRNRVFTKPGVYRYRSTLHDAEGEIIVCDEKNDPHCGDS